MRPALVVMAAGIGSRYGGLKQLDPIGPSGELLLDYAVFDAARAGIERIVFVIRREIEHDFHVAVGRRYASRLDVIYAFQELDDVPARLRPVTGRIKPWGTGHAVLAAREAVGGPFIVINADDIYGPQGIADLTTILSAGTGAAREHAMVAYRLGQTLSAHGTVSRGVCTLDDKGMLRAIEECTGVRGGPHGTVGIGPDGLERRFTGGEPVSMNLWGLRPTVFSLLAERFERFLADHAHRPGAEFYLPHAITDLIGEGAAAVRVLDTSFRWLGVTVREDRDAVGSHLRELVAAGTYPTPLWGG
jgi:hypothetical protein